MDDIEQEWPDIVSPYAGGIRRRLAKSPIDADEYRNVMDLKALAERLERAVEDGNDVSREDLARAAALIRILVAFQAQLKLARGTGA